MVQLPGAGFEKLGRYYCTVELVGRFAIKTCNNQRIDNLNRVYHFFKHRHPLQPLVGGEARGSTLFTNRSSGTDFSPRVEASSPLTFCSGATDASKHTRQKSNGSSVLTMGEGFWVWYLGCGFEGLGWGLVLGRIPEGWGAVRKAKHS